MNLLVELVLAVFGADLYMVLVGLAGPGCIWSRYMYEFTG
jgi:hypothetical protein